MELEEVDDLIEQYKIEIEAVVSISGREKYYFGQIQPTGLQAGRDILLKSPRLQADMVDKIGSRKDDAAYLTFKTLEAKMLSRKLPLTSDAVERLMKRAVTSHIWYDYWMVTVKQVVHFVNAGSSITPSLKAGVARDT